MAESVYPDLASVPTLHLHEDGEYLSVGFVTSNDTLLEMPHRPTRWRDHDRAAEWVSAVRRYLPQPNDAGELQPPEAAWPYVDTVRVADPGSCIRCKSEKPLAIPMGDDGMFGWCAQCAIDELSDRNERECAQGHEPLEGAELPAPCGNCGRPRWECACEETQAAYSAGDSLLDAVTTFEGKEFRVSAPFEQYPASVVVVDKIPREHGYRDELNVIVNRATLTEAVEAAVEYVVLADGHEAGEINLGPALPRRRTFSGACGCGEGGEGEPRCPGPDGRLACDEEA